MRYDNKTYIDTVATLAYIVVGVILFSLCVEVSMALGDMLASL
jgi:hypothetical protein